MAVRIYLEIGHEASLRTKKTQEGFTHDWEVFVRGCEGADIHYYVEKVVFYLHETFQKPKRVVKEPPYSVKESGYAGFNLPIDIYLRNSSEPKKIRFNYDLNLQPAGPAILKVQKEKYVFNSPSEDFKMKLLKGGGAIGNSSSGGSGQEVSENRSSFDEKNQMTNKPKLSGCSSDLLKKAKMKTDEPFKNFQELFGSPIITSSIKNLQETKQQTWKDPKSSKPDKGIDKAKSKHSPHKDSHKDKEKSKDKSSDSTEKKKDKDEKKSKDKFKDRERSKDKSVKRDKSPRPKSPSPTTHNKRPPSPAARPPSPPPVTKHSKEAKHEKREQERKAKKEKRKHEESKSEEQQREKKQKEAKTSSSPPPSSQKPSAPVDKPKEKEKKEKVSKDTQKDEPREKHSSKSKKRDKEKRDKKEEKHSKSDKKVDGKARQEQQAQPPPPPPPPKKEKPPPYVPPPDLIDDSSNSSGYSISSIKPEVKPKERQKDEKSNKSKKDKGENSIKCKRKPDPQVDEEPPAKRRDAASDAEQEDSNKSRAPEFPKEPEDDYLDVLRELQHKIMDLKNNEDLQRVVQLIATTGQYEISAHTFDFDLCLLDRATVQQLQEFFTT